MTYKITREDGTLHSEGLSIRDCLEIADGLGFDLHWFQQRLTKNGRMTIHDGIDEMTIEVEMVPVE